MPDLFETDEYPHSEPFPKLPGHFSLVSAQKTGGTFCSESHHRMKHDYGLIGFHIIEVNEGRAFLVGHQGRPEDHTSIEKVAWHYGQTEVIHSSGNQHTMVFQEPSEPNWHGTGIVHGPFLKSGYTKLSSGHRFQLHMESPFNKSAFEDIREDLQADEVLAGRPFHYGTIEGINIFHAEHPAHDELQGLHVEDVRPKQLPKLIIKALKEGQPALILRGTVPSELRGRGPQGVFPHCYDWVDTFKADVVKTDVAPSSHEAIYRPIVEKYGTIIHERKTNLQFYDGIQNLDDDSDYIRAWRRWHESAHQLTEKDINKMYDEGRRGRLGEITPREAKRALHWEYVAAYKQRELAEEIGFKISDEDFNRELNTLMHESTHRIITGKSIEPSAEGFEPSPLPLDWAHTLKFIEETAQRLGLLHDEQTFVSAKVPRDVTDVMKTEGTSGPLMTGGNIRQFHLERMVDETGISGSGRVAEGCVFTNGWVSMVWLTRTGSLCFYPSIQDVEQVHGHGGKTKVVFEDGPLTKTFTQADGETLTDPRSHLASAGAVPKSLMDWGAEKLSSMKPDGIEVLELNGRIIKVRKVLEDLYSGWIEFEGQIRHQFEKLTMPELLSQLQSKLELYGKEDEVVADETPARNVPTVPTEEPELSVEKEAITTKLKELQTKIAEQVAVVSGKDLVEGIENPEKECPACERPVLQCVCYSGLPKPRIIVTSKGVEIFFKSEWNEEDQVNFLTDLKRRAGTILHQKLIKKAEHALTDLRKRMKGDRDQ